MIENKGTARTRPYTYAEVLRAVAHALQRPHQTLPEPKIEARRPVRKGHHVDAVLSLGADDPLLGARLAGVLAWVRVLDPVVVVQLARSSGTHTSVEVIGRLGDGPMVSITALVEDMPVEIPAWSSQVIPLAELVALGADAAAAGPTPAQAVDALVGAR